MAARKRLKRGDHLVLRGSVWTYRRTVPEALRPKLGHEIVRSMKTGDVVEARRRSARFNVEVDGLFEAARQNVVSALEDARTSVEDVCALFARDALEDDRAERTRLRDVEVGENDDVNRGFVQGLLDDSFEAGHLPTAEAISVLKRHGLTLPADAMGDLLFDLKRTMITARGDVERDRDADIQGQRRLDLPSVPSEVVIAPAAPAATASPPLGELMQKYQREKVANGEWSQRYAAATRSTLDSWVKFAGSQREVGEITRSDVKAWRDQLTVGQSTRRGHLHKVSAFLNWCEIDEECISKNVAKGAAPSEPSRRTGAGRRAYTDNELKALFCAKLSEHRERRPDHYWVAHLGLYTGARITELAQLAVGDVVRHDGVLCLEIRPDLDGQEVKNTGSIRCVPVHSHILALNFEAYVAQRKAAGEQWLFPHCERDAAGRGAGANLSKFWTDWRKRVVKIDTPNATFHSFRHCVVRDLLKRKVAKHVVMQIVGHTDQSMTTGRYNEPLPAPQLQEAVERLDYRGVCHAVQPDVNA